MDEKSLFQILKERVIQSGETDIFYIVDEKYNLLHYSYMEIFKRASYYKKILNKYQNAICAIYHHADLNLIAFIVAALDSKVKIIIKRTSIQNDFKIENDIEELKKTIPVSLVFATHNMELPYDRDEAADLWIVENDIVKINNEELFSYIQLTSGSTAVPRAFCLTEDGLIDSADCVRKYHHIDSDSKIFSYLTLSHIYGFVTGFVLPLLADAKCYWCETTLIHNGKINVLKVAEKYKITHMAIVLHTIKEALHKMDQEGGTYNLETLECLSMGGEKVEKEIFNEIRTGLSGCGVNYKSIVNSYGMSEKGAISMEDPVVGNSFSMYDNVEYLAVGNSDSESTKIKIFNLNNEEILGGGVGRIGVSSPHLAKLYFEDRKIFRVELINEQYYLNGDLGYIKDNKVYIVGREKNTVVYNGLKTSSEQIENFVRENLKKGNIEIRRSRFFNIPGRLNCVIGFLDTVAKVDDCDKEKLKKKINGKFHVVIQDWIIRDYKGEGLGKISTPKLIEMYKGKVNNGYH